MHRDQQPATLEGKTNSAPRRGGAARTAQAHRLALEVEQFFRIDLAADVVDRQQQFTLERRELLDLSSQALGVAQRFPGGLEAKSDRRGRRPPQVVRRHTGRDVRIQLVQQRANAPGVLAFPRLEHQQVRARKQQIHAVCAAANEHDTSRHEWLDGSGQCPSREHPPSLGNAIQELAGGARQEPRIAQLGQLHE